MTIAFLIIAGSGLAAALGAVLARNLVHAGLFLTAFFLMVAGMFVLLEAEFLAALQVLIYVGAIAMILMFGIMLTGNVQGDATTRIGLRSGLLAGLVALGIGGMLIVGLSGKFADRTVRPERPADSPEGKAIADMSRAVGDEMLTRYVVPFEIAGLLLTAAVVGAVAISIGDPQEPENSERLTEATR